MAVAVILFVTPFVVFLMTGIVLTGTVIGVAGVVPVALLGLALYVFATGTLPARPRLAQ